MALDSAPSEIRDIVRDLTNHKKVGSKRLQLFLEYIAENGDEQMRELMAKIIKSALESRNLA